MQELGRTSLGGSAHKQTQRSPGAPPGGMHPSPRAPESPSFDGSGGSSPVAVSPSTRHSPRHFVVRQSVQLALHTEEVATYPSNTAAGTADSLQPHGQVATAGSLQQAPAQQRLGVAVHRGVPFPNMPVAAFAASSLTSRPVPCAMQDPNGHRAVERRG